MLSLAGMIGFSSLLEPLWGPKEFLVSFCLRSLTVFFINKTHILYYIQIFCVDIFSPGECHESCNRSIGDSAVLRHLPVLLSPVSHPLCVCICLCVWSLCVCVCVRMHVCVSVCMYVCVVSACICLCLCHSYRMSATVGSLPSTD